MQKENADYLHIPFSNCYMFKSCLINSNVAVDPNTAEITTSKLT